MYTFNNALVTLPLFHKIESEGQTESYTSITLIPFADYQKQELESKTSLKICGNLFKTFAHVSSVEWNNQRIYYDYKNVIDIFTYDDLIRRLKMIITQLKKI